MILGADAPRPAMVASAQSELAEVLAACDELMAIDDSDLVLRRAVELARERLGLERVGLFLVDEPRGLMLGTWGTDLEGRSVNEHHVMYEIGGNDREAFRRATEDGAPFTLIDNCPIVVQLEAETKIVGRGWVACTPIRSARGNIGMLFNDSGPDGPPVDDAKQARAAILCSVLGTILELSHGRPGQGVAGQLSTAGHPVVVSSLRLLAKDPTLTARKLAPKLHISSSRLARVFKAEMGMSLVEYRNRLRLERFQVLLDAGGENLLEAALAAGFGSYAQFYRVYRAVRGAPPRASLRERPSSPANGRRPS